MLSEGVESFHVAAVRQNLSMQGIIHHKDQKLDLETSNMHGSKHRNMAVFWR
jgi:hypothetical protein